MGRAETRAGRPGTRQSVSDMLEYQRLLQSVGHTMVRFVMREMRTKTFLLNSKYICATTRNESLGFFHSRTTERAPRIVPFHIPRACTQQIVPQREHFTEMGDRLVMVIVVEQRGVHKEGGHALFQNPNLASAVEVQVLQIKHKKRGVLGGGPDGQRGALNEGDGPEGKEGLYGGHAEAGEARRITKSMMGLVKREEGRRVEEAVLKICIHIRQEDQGQQVHRQKHGGVDHHPDRGIRIN
eukprot:CAMPEP_0119123142 /NCGR_PEP_ID=MMETSP1310-20130426/3177_1 /TAXON_ID=464262 /ORGANISM="Genus nov. species nov., Strain RCC2339" /LENGTH=239 /DNA_ID=CAMNT_0007112897 /DNA_START=42 /DNA_END=761 /DNA_ORIENTATION=+